MSPPGLRGLYQGVWGSSWGLSFFAGPVIGGFLFGHYGPQVLWAGAFVLGLILCVGYIALSVPAKRRAAAVAAAPD
jgi:MFS family permease